MRIHTENTELFLQALSTTISKDPASLENWRCLHVVYHENRDVEWYEEILKHLQRTNKDLDCEVIYCADDDIFFISRHLQVDELYHLANRFIRVAYNDSGKAGEVALYDLYHDARLVSKILQSKITTPMLPMASASTHDFGETHALKEVFNEAKQRRNARQPLHVMVVEDDVLTRRLVTNAFKENFALITASTAQEAVENYLLYAPDIVFLDIGLPDASGFDVLRQMIATDADAYVVMFSGNSYLDNVTTAFSQGASGFVAKPFKQDKMRHYILGSAAHHHKQYA
jgi:two-component system, chemotaxis family, chemotaxis protein CheY